MGSQSKPGAAREVSALATMVASVKPFPDVVHRVRNAAADSRTTVVDLARIVERDIGIASDLLRLVNAPTSGLAQKCTSVRHAVTLLGMRRVVDVVVSAAALSFVEETSAQAPSIAAHAVAVAGVARMLASLIGISPDEAFTVGLLHDVGVLCILQNGDLLYEELLEQVGPDSEPSPEEERALLGFDHCVLGGHVLRHWNLPGALPDAVTFHHDWAAAVEAGGPVLAMVALLRVADTLVSRLRASDEPPSQEEYEELAFAEPAFVHLGLRRDELFHMWSGLQNSCEKAQIVRNPESAVVEEEVSETRLTSSAAAARQSTPADTEAGGPAESNTKWVIGAGMLVAAAIGAVLAFVH